MKLTNIAMSAEEAKEYGGAVPATDTKNLPKYPWGLCLDLNDDTLAKLGITELPAVDSTVMVMARCTVTSIRESQNQGGDAEKSVSLQITEMSVGPDVSDAPAKRTADVMYPKK